MTLFGINGLPSPVSISGNEEGYMIIEWVYKGRYLSLEMEGTNIWVKEGFLSMTGRPGKRYFETIEVYNREWIRAADTALRLFKKWGMV